MLCQVGSYSCREIKLNMGNKTLEINKSSLRQMKEWNTKILFVHWILFLYYSPMLRLHIILYLFPLAISLLISLLFIFCQINISTRLVCSKSKMLINRKYMPNVKRSVQPLQGFNALILPILYGSKD